MAVTTTNELRMILTFADEDTRTMTIENPAASIVAAGTDAADAINALSQHIAEYQIFLGDKNQAAFVRIGSAKIVDRSVNKMTF